MTDDDAMDENPQIAAVKLNEDDETESFVIGWSSTSGTGMEQENDISWPLWMPMATGSPALWTPSPT